MNKELEIKEDRAAIADEIMTRKAAFVEGAVGILQPHINAMMANLQHEMGTLEGEDQEKLLKEITDEFTEYLGAGMGRAFKRFKRINLGE